MHHARLSESLRLQRALRVLEERFGQWVTTRTLVRKANICAVNSVVAELRENGCRIECEQRSKDGQRRFFYRLTKTPEEWNGTVSKD